ncbi:MAG TPA: hypothetical protein VH143_18825 [Kofleriaceae bacterium]|nr:hypothetical protein [Kofleriaceae bacterium]
MSRQRLIIATAALAIAPSLVYADDAPAVPATSTDSPTQKPTDASVAPVAPAAPADMSDQAIGASIGVATGGRVTPGGLRVEGHYLYQLSDRDWFDGRASFTFGGGAAECFYDRTDTYVCDHGLAQGDGLEVIATVRHFLGGQGMYWPFVQGGIGAGIARFGADGVSGLIIPLHAGGGVRASIAPAIAIVAAAELEFGLGVFGHDIGAEPQFGIDITAGVEFRL